MPETNTIQPGALVITWDGSRGTVLAFVAGWYRLRMEDGCIAEWQRFQLELVEMAVAA